MIALALLLLAQTDQVFVERHCVECHGPEVQKAKLRLDTLAPESETWTRVLDRVRSGEMPPQARPPRKDVEAFTSALAARLHQASLSRQRRDGRVRLRRLNRTEYENTLRDLLGLRMDVKELLPEDNSVAGFDTVSEGLDISSAHLLCYQEAAEKALTAALKDRPRPPATTLVTASQMAALRGVKGQLGKYFALRDSSLICFTQVPPYTEVWTPAAPVGGRYRVRLSAAAVHTAGRSLPVAFQRLPDGAVGTSDAAGCLDVPAGAPAVLELEVDLRERQRVLFNAWTLPVHSEFDRARKKPETEPGLAIDFIELEGPLDRAAGIGLFDGRDPDPLLRAFVPRAARRPVPPDVIDGFVRFARTRMERGYSFTDAMMAAYKAVLCSPSFLFLAEAPGRLDEYAVASRLSYFLWRSMPDAVLMELAAQGNLSRREALAAQVERMLRDPKAQRFIDDFTGQWLDLRNINATSPDPVLYGEFDLYLFWSMPRETKLFFTEVLDRNLGVATFVQSDWTFVNERLARHYGIPGVEGSAFRKIVLPEGSHRGGVLTQAAILKVTADGTRTSPILRGKWVLDRILGKPPSPPPPGISGIEPDIRGATTIRQQLEKHRNTPACAGCHRQIDPPGFALETFDVIGGWRDSYRIGKKGSRGPDVEKGDRTPDGRPFKDIDEYKRILLEDEEQLARNVLQKLLVFATGADLQFADREVVAQILSETRASGHGLRSILHAVVASRPFLNQ